MRALGRLAPRKDREFSWNGGGIGCGRELIADAGVWLRERSRRRTAEIGLSAATGWVGLSEGRFRWGPGRKADKAERASAFVVLLPKSEGRSPAARRLLK